MKVPLVYSSYSINPIQTAQNIVLKCHINEGLVGILNEGTVILILNHAVLSSI